MTSEQFHPGQLVMVSIEGKVLGRDQAAFLRENHIRVEAEVKALRDARATFKDTVPAMNPPLASTCDF